MTYYKMHMAKVTLDKVTDDLISSVQLQRLMRASKAAKLTSIKTSLDAAIRICEHVIVGSKRKVIVYIESEESNVDTLTAIVGRDYASCVAAMKAYCAEATEEGEKNAN